jgi:uncharacterized protein YlxP (DUF503 family)
MIHIGYCSIELHFPECHSLKDKRMILKSMKERMKNRFNIALAEEDHTELWQRSRLGIVSLALEKQAVMNTFDKVLEQIEMNGSVQIVNIQKEYF